MTECTHDMPLLKNQDCPYCALEAVLVDLRGLLEINMWSEAGKEWQRQIADIYNRYREWAPN